MSQIPASNSLTLESCDSINSPTFVQPSSPTASSSTPQRPHSTIAKSGSKHLESGALLPATAGSANLNGDNQTQLFQFSNNDNQVLLTRRNLELQQRLQQQQTPQQQQQPSGFCVSPLDEKADLNWWGLSRGSSKTYEILGPTVETGLPTEEVMRLGGGILHVKRETGTKYLFQPASAIPI